MADYSYTSEVFFDELLRISSNIVWKDPIKSTQYEIQDEIVNVEQYILARQGNLTFDLIEQFDESVLRAAGLSQEVVENAVDDKHQIPEAMRAICTKKQCDYIVQNYVEMNNYYRMLNGLPDMEDEDFVYNTDYPAISSSDIPLHQLDSSQLYALEANGYLAKIQEAHKDKEYLKHLTDKKIDIYLARNSDPFSILWCADSSYSTLRRDFLDTYNECKYMVYNVFYQGKMNRSNSLYTSFIGMCILFQTIMRMHYKFLDTDITRDFYDEDSLRLVYDSYSVPYYASIPIEYHKKIVKNINILIQHKGSTRVFYDLFEIFGFDGMAIFEFYLMKVHRFKDGKPIFVKNEDGSYNYREMYDILFGKVQLYNDPTVEMMKPKNRVSYAELTEPDPYWFNDKELQDKLYSEEFNYMESKYMGIQTTFNLMKILYETCYYVKMILDNREILSATSLYNSSTRTNTNLFELVVYISALITKKYGYEGNIPTDMHQIGKVMGFNFQQDLLVLKENISQNDYLKDDSMLLKYLETMNVYSLASVQKIYKNLASLRKHLVRKMADTDDVNVYWAYYELYRTLMYSEYTSSVFTKSDGEQATSFADMLKDLNGDLYEKYTLKTEETDINNEISDMLYLLKSSCSALENIQYADNINIDTVIEYLFKLLDFFKSAKAELTGYEIIYSLAISGENYIKYINLIDRITDDYTTDPQKSIFEDLTDLIGMVRIWMNFRSQFWLKDRLPLICDQAIFKNAIIRLEDDISHMIESMRVLSSELGYIEDVSVEEVVLLDSDKLKFRDRLIMMYEELKEVLKFVVIDEWGISDIISYIRQKSKQPLSREEIITLLSQLSVVEYYNAQKSRVTFNDDLIDLGSMGFLDSSFSLLDQLLQNFERRYGLEDIIPLDTLVELVRDVMKMGISSYSFKDKIEEETITLLYTDLEKNKIQYMTEMTINCLKYYLEEPFVFKEVLSCLDIPQECMKDMFTQYDFLTDSIEVTMPKGNRMRFKDSLILRSIQTFED